MSVRLRVVVVCLVWVTASACLPYQAKNNPLALNRAVSLQLQVSGRAWRIHYRETGKPGNPAVVLIHGYGSASVVFVPLMRRLAKEGYHCLALDLPGFGLSDKWRGNYDTRNIARIVSQFMKVKRISRADVVAHSWGSSVTLAFALQFPRKVRRIVINSGWVYDAQLVPVIRWAKLPLVGELLYGMFYREMVGERLAHSVYDGRRFATIPVIRQVHKSYKRPGAMASALAVARGMNFKGMEKRYHTIVQPTLLQWGRQDRVALPFYGRRLVSHLPNARLVFLDRCGHMPMLERPHAFVRNIVQFLGKASRIPPKIR